MPEFDLQESEQRCGGDRELLRELIDGSGPAGER